MACYGIHNAIRKQAADAIGVRLKISVASPETYTTHASSSSRLGAARDVAGVSKDEAGYSPQLRMDALPWMRCFQAVNLAVAKYAAAACSATV
jgi:hypothetical protein